MNNKMSKLLAIVLCVVMMLSSVAAVTADSLSGDADTPPAETATPAESTPSAEPTDPAEEPSETDGEEPADPAEEPSETDGEKTLFERIMACTTLEEIFAILDETPEEELLALTEEENQQIEALIVSLEPEPLPPVVLEESQDEPVVSEIVYPTVTFTNVAPFGDPVVGGAD